MATRTWCRAGALAVGLALSGLVGCSDDAVPDDEAQGVEVVLDRAEDIAEGSSPEQEVSCEIQQRTIRTAVAAFRATTGEVDAEPDIEELDQAGLLDPDADIAYEIPEYVDGEPQLQAMAGGPCEGAG